MKQLLLIFFLAFSLINDDEKEKESMGSWEQLQDFPGEGRNAITEWLLEIWSSAKQMDAHQRFARSGPDWRSFIRNTIRLMIFGEK